MAEWWKEQAVYQIYPRSFNDSNGDGYGDIQGIIERLDYLRELGIGVIWLSPVYKSPGADNGYDISDYRDIDPMFGTMEDMERLIAEASKRGIRIIMDLVINHTSDEHEWFQKSRDKDGDYRDYYIWRKAKPDGALPNNWRGFFMEDVWEFDEKSGEYYLHLFHKKQPDLNYRNPKVVEEVKGILKFWLDKGVCGFRCDVINVLYKTSLDDGKKSLSVQGIEHYKSQEGNHQILKKLRREVLGNYDSFTVGETVMVDVEEARDLCEPEREELDMLFYFDHLEVDRRVARYIGKRFSAKKLLDVLTKWQRGLSWNALYLENHDQPRIVSHYGDDKRYLARSAKMLGVMQFTLRGTPFIYEGQEIGMTNFDFTSIEQCDDVESRNVDKMMRKYGIPKVLRWKWIKQASRDNARTPMQWSGERNAGFTRGVPWLPVNKNYKHINAAAQRNDPDSVLSFYKNLIDWRKNSELLKFGEFQPLFANERVMAYKRVLKDEELTVILNFSPNHIRADVSGEVVLSNTERRAFDKKLLPYEAVVLSSGGGEVNE